MPKKQSDEKSEKINYGTTVISWRAPEYQEHERGEKWVMGAAVAALILMMWAIWQGTYSFAVIVLLLAGLYFLTHRHTPREIDISLTTVGILADTHFFPYANIETFWILYHPEKNLKILNIAIKSGFVREMDLQLAEQDPAEVRSFLMSHMLELEGRTETILEKIIRVLKL